jgi:N6-adenosine-specific RNA methylase IME4
MTYEIHPLAKLIPQMSAEEFTNLRNDIDANGLIEPIWLYEGMVLDGRHRYTACMELGVTPKFRQFEGVNPIDFVVSENLHRRHLSSSQLAVIAVDIEREQSVFAKARQKSLAGTRPNSQPDLVALIPQGERGKSRDIAAKAMGTSPRYVSDAKKLQREAPELIEPIRNGEMTITQAKTIVRRQERVERINEVSTGNKPLETVTEAATLYPVIYADPAWEYEHVKTESRAIENHYPTMSLFEICDLPVSSIATQDAILFMWATNPKLAEAIQVIVAWGFTYRTNMVWVKDRIGMGYYARSQHELLLIATRGSIPTPEPANRPASVIEAPRLEHSAKPELVYGLIEAMYPEFQKVELFARNRREGWAAWGNQSNS